MLQKMLQKIIDTLVSTKAKVIAYSVGLALVAASLWAAYDHVYTKGYQRGTSDCELKYTKVILADTLAQSKKLDQTLEGLHALSVASIDKDTKLASDMQDIRKLIKSPMVVYNNSTGCTVSKEFLSAREKAINRANAK